MLPQMQIIKRSRNAFKAVCIHVKDSKEVYVHVKQSKDPCRHIQSHFERRYCPLHSEACKRSWISDLSDQFSHQIIEISIETRLKDQKRGTYHQSTAFPFSSRHPKPTTLDHRQKTARRPNRRAILMLKSLNNTQGSNVDALSRAVQRGMTREKRKAAKKQSRDEAEFSILHLPFFRCFPSWATASCFEDHEIRYK